MPFLGDNEFLAHFWQYDPVTVVYSVCQTIFCEKVIFTNDIASLGKMKNFLIKILIGPCYVVQPTTSASTSLLNDLV